MRPHAVPLAVAALAVLGFVAYVVQVLDGPPGLADAKAADRLLADGKPQAALAAYDEALRADPDLLPARLGRALALAAADDETAAERALDTLVMALRPTAGDSARRPFLAAALANRGILRDRQGRHDEALVDYRAALRADAGTVAGPGVLDRMLHGASGTSSVAERAAYLEQQLALPPERRRLDCPGERQQQPVMK